MFAMMDGKTPDAESSGGKLTPKGAAGALSFDAAETQTTKPKQPDMPGTDGAPGLGWLAVLFGLGWVVTGIGLRRASRMRRKQ